MRVIASNPSDYLGPDDVVDSDHPQVQALAHRLRASHLGDAGFAEAAFIWVRDEVAHSFDALDPRGNKPGVDAQFSLSGECLAWVVDPQQGEVDYPTLHVRPHPQVIEALRGAGNVLELYSDGLPSDLKE